MFASIRRYRLESGSIDGLLHLIDTDFAERIQTLDGFLEYQVVECGNGEIITLTTFEDRQSAEASLAVAAAWVRTRSPPAASTSWRASWVRSRSAAPRRACWSPPATEAQRRPASQRGSGKGEKASAADTANLLASSFPTRSRSSRRSAAWRRGPRRTSWPRRRRSCGFSRFRWRWVSRAIWAMAKSLKKGRRRVTVRNTNSGLPGNAVRQTALASAALLVLLLWTCGAASGAVRLNQIQVVGTHNSYHVEASPAEKALRIGSGLIDESTLEYGFPPLTEQLDLQGVRQIELDVWADPAGGLYAAPRLRTLALEGPYDPAMSSPASRSCTSRTTTTARRASRSRRACRRSRPGRTPIRGHVPLAILRRAQGHGAAASASPPRSRCRGRACRWTRSTRRSAPSSRPSASSSRTRARPPPDAGGRRAARRLAGARGEPRQGAVPDGQRRALPHALPARAIRACAAACSSPTARPACPTPPSSRPTTRRGAELARIRRAVRLGYVVRTRADEDTREARSGDMRRARRALASGAQWVSTDYPAPGIAARFGTDYVVRLPRPARCNPVNAPRGCRERAPGSRALTLTVARSPSSRSRVLHHGVAGRCARAVARRRRSRTARATAPTARARRRPQRARSPSARIRAGGRSPRSSRRARAWRRAARGAPPPRGPRR